MTGCACVSEVNNHLRGHNSALITTMFAQPERVVITTTKVNDRQRGKPVPMIATYCPFCGQAIWPSSTTRTAPPATSKATSRRPLR